jgi:hypothetical protein
MFEPSVPTTSRTYVLPEVSGPVFCVPFRATEPKVVSEALAAFVVVQVRSTDSPLAIVLVAGVSVHAGAGFGVTVIFE